jgi:DNA-binding SARP family transcriptional activator
MGMRRRNGRPPVRRLSVGLFGGVRFAFDTEPWRFSAPPRTLPLLAYLILHRTKAVARESAAFALWPDDDESTARANFRRHLLYLRNALPEPPPGRPWILSDGRATVQWNPDAACRIDAVEFERLSADDASIAAAAELYAGDLLEDLSDDWIIAERERLRDLQVSNLSKLIVAARRDGEIAESLQFAQQLFALDSWREDALRHVMELRYALGDRAGALAEYERFASRLETELNASPMAESRACYESLVRNAPVLHEARTSATPGDVAARHALLPFVGREHELERLQVWWTRAARGGGNVGLVGGEAGIGKSRLLAELKRIAESQGGRVLLGAAGSSGGLAYRPIVEALTAAVPMLETVSIEPIWLAVAANLLPSLARSRFDVHRPPAIEAGQERVRLFEAVFQLLRALAEQRPVLLVLEDLHWSGQATIDLVDYLDDRIGGTRILIVGSYRDEEVLRAHPLRRLRRKLDRYAGRKTTQTHAGAGRCRRTPARAQRRKSAVHHPAYREFFRKPRTRPADGACAWPTRGRRRAVGAFVVRYAIPCDDGFGHRQCVRRRTAARTNRLE